MKPCTKKKLKAVGFGWLCGLLVALGGACVFGCLFLLTHVLGDGWGLAVYFGSIALISVVSASINTYRKTKCDDSKPETARDEVEG